MNASKMPLGLNWDELVWKIAPMSILCWRVIFEDMRCFCVGHKKDHVGTPLFKLVPYHHKKTFSVALLRSDGMIKDWSSPAEITRLTQTLSSLPVEIGAACYEAGPTGFGLARSLRVAGIKVIVDAPSRIPRPVSPTNKNDSLDIRKLSEYQDFYIRMFDRHGISQKAIAAFARKLAALLWKLSLPAAA